MNRRNLLLAAASTPLLSACLYDRRFDLDWDEEVRLHDGRVIVVHLKNTYERIHQGFTRYGGTIMSRDTTLTFDTGGTSGKVTQLFKGYSPSLLDQHEGAWYVTLRGGPYYRSEEMPGQNWGRYPSLNCDEVAKLVGTEFVPIRIQDLPRALRMPNMLLYGTAAEHAQFHERRISLKNKEDWLVKHPLSSGHINTCRPREEATSPTGLSTSNKEAGGSK
ncbi:hypothetical protein PMI15_01377 [Polaromonas sp. CF318]|uniref:hypothetical protein n=1 Tax=Polaromonas sp. CF318 TaxID=1144318 RepID=UPI000270F968|nr:hypothetical protein [Polaromonas sp. CF318]EJL86530.1 hypothetical protein PMI15_01377 [Polaromonas sp. CF318]